MNENLSQNINHIIVLYHALYGQIELIAESAFVHWFILHCMRYLVASWDVPPLSLYGRCHSLAHHDWTEPCSAGSKAILQWPRISCCESRQKKGILQWHYKSLQVISSLSKWLELFFQNKCGVLKFTIMSRKSFFFFFLHHHLFGELQQIDLMLIK